MDIDRTLTKRRFNLFKSKMKDNLINTYYYIDESHTDKYSTSLLVCSKNTGNELTILYYRGGYFGFHKYMIMTSNGVDTRISGLIYFYSIDDIIRWIKEHIDIRLI